MQQGSKRGLDTTQSINPGLKCGARTYDIGGEQKHGQQQQRDALGTKQSLKHEKRQVHRFSDSGSSMR
jgi:hypothetical protein